MGNVTMHPTLLAALNEALENRAVSQWREIAEQTRDKMLAGHDPVKDADILHAIREMHIAFGAACAFEAAAELEAAIARADELEATFELINAAQMRAIKMWQDANPGNDLVWPDGAELTLWLMDATDRILDLTTERDRLLAERRVVAEAVSVAADLHAALAAHTCQGCPACPGDCSSANPPMIGCPTRQAIDAYRRYDAFLARHTQEAERG